MADPQTARPAIRISGPATPEEVAAVVAVLLAAGGDGDDPPRRVSTWAAHDVTMRRPVPHGTGAWRTTYRR